MLVRAGMRSPKPAVLTPDLHISDPKHDCSSGPTGSHGLPRLRKGEDLRCRRGAVLRGASRGMKPGTFGLHDSGEFPPIFADFLQVSRKNQNIFTEKCTKRLKTRPGRKWTGRWTAHNFVVFIKVRAFFAPKFSRHLNFTA